MTEFRWGSATDTGRVRSDNQDQLLIAAPVFVVADGMGGHNGGEVAAAIAVDEMAKVTDVASLEALSEAIEGANREIVDRSKLEPELRGMGTTIVALVDVTIDDEPRLALANVGDSRIYVRAEGELQQLTEDHTLVEALVRDGRLTPEEAADHPQRNIVTRALGIDERVLVDTWEAVPVAGDRYVLCSDGLFGEIDDDTILDVLDEVEDPDVAASELVQLACDAGGRDNVTVVVVDIVATEAKPSHAPAGRITTVRKAVPDGVGRVGATPMEVEGSAADPHPDEIVVDRSATKAPFVTWRVGLFVVAVLAVIAVLLISLVAYARSGYFVGTDGDDVVIYEGRPDGLLWIDPTVEEPVVLTVDELDPDDLSEVTNGVEFDSLDEARQYADTLVQRAVTDDP